MGIEGNTVRLRASCNACNESKVRCSQQKPTCARCERNGTECIYGLSRRTHRDAPPISMPSSQRAWRPSRSSSSNGDIDSNRRGLSFTKSDTTTPSDGGSSPGILACMYDANLFGDYLLPQQQDDVAAAKAQFHMADPIYCAGQLLDFSNLVTDSSLDSLSAVATGFPTPSPEYQFLFGASQNSDGSAAQHMAMPSPTRALPPSSCTCHVGVTELLPSMRVGGNDRGISLDTQLAKLKQCIMSAETSIACTHGCENAEPIHIMTVATLIGYVIDEFKMLASDDLLRRSSAAAGETGALGNTERTKSRSGMVATEPRLSWGVLELEDDDEMDLRQRLYLLSFRKLERLLSQLTLYLRNLYNARANLPDPSRHISFLVACDYTRLWLEKKAEDVKRLFSVSIPSAVVNQF